jgi:uncharacterized membrane protein YbhN (UPF0104 family)
MTVAGTTSRTWWRGFSAPPWLWPAVKIVLTVAIVGAVAWEFVRILRRPELWAHPPRLSPAWLAAATGLYLAGLAFWGFFWHYLLRLLGQRPHLLATLRAYYVGQLGRYVPGKLVGVALRARLLAGPGVRLGVAVVTVVYEWLTTLASGVLLGVLFLGLLAPGHATLGGRAAGLLVLAGVLLLPGVFNRLAERTARPFRAPDASPLPPVHGRALLAGLGITACGWLLQGGVLWAVVDDLSPGAWVDPAPAWLRCTAYAGLAYAAGFLVLAAPGGLGVRDFLIQQFLAADLGARLGAGRAAATATVAALLLRLLWTVVDVGAAGVCWCLRGSLCKEDATNVPGQS